MVSKKAKKTEEKILNAAIKIFTEKGYSAATTSEIAKEAGIAEGTIFRYFPKKKEILHSVVYKFLDTFAESIVFDSLYEIINENQDKSMKELLKIIALDRIKLFKSHFPYAHIMFNEMQYHEDIRKLFLDKIMANVFDIAKLIFKEGQKRGEFKDIDPIIGVRSFMGMLGFMFMQRRFMPEYNVYNSLEEEIEALIDLYFDGISNK